MVANQQQAGNVVAMGDVIVSEIPPLIAEGVYTLAYKWHETGAYMGGRASKLKVVFSVVDPGPAYGCLVTRYYNVKELIGKPRKWGRFKVGAMTDFYREYCRLFHSPNRLDRISMERFKDVLITGQVVTVKRDRKQRDLADGAQYSKVEELLGVKRL